MVYLYTRILLVTQKNEVVANATAWMNLEKIMLSERTYDKRSYCRIQFLRNIYNKQTHRDKKQIGGCRVRRNGRRQGRVGE